MWRVWDVKFVSSDRLWADRPLLMWKRALLFVGFYKVNIGSDELLLWDISWYAELRNMLFSLLVVDREGQMISGAHGILTLCGMHLIYSWRGFYTIRNILDQPCWETLLHTYFYYTYHTYVCLLSVKLQRIFKVFYIKLK